LSKTTTYEWYKRFQSGTTSTDDDERSGQPSTLRNETLTAQVKEVIQGNNAGSSGAREGCGMKEVTSNVDCRNMPPPSQQHTSSNSFVDSRVLGKTFNSCPPTTLLFT
jgi:hypothetical protein